MIWLKAWKRLKTRKVRFIVTMIKIKEIQNPSEKSTICNNILRALPNWFGHEASIVDYTDKVKEMPFYAAFDSDKVVGFIALKTHNIHTSEVCVMGILEDYHRQGIGKILIEHCESYCRRHKIEFLTVKTLDESAESISYQKTRQFYLSVGFKPLEVFPLHWDADNPCLFMVKHIKMV